MDDLIAVTAALASALAEHAFLEGWRLRNVLERALGRAQVLGEQLPDDGERAAALHQLTEMHRIGARLLMRAPAPTAAAIAARKAGNATLWDDEARAWVASRLSGGVVPMPASRRELDDDDPPQERRATAEPVEAIGTSSPSAPEPKKAAAL